MIALRHAHPPISGAGKLLFNVATLILYPQESKRYRMLTLCVYCCNSKNEIYGPEFGMSNKGLWSTRGQQGAVVEYHTDGLKVWNRGENYCGIAIEHHGRNPDVFALPTPGNCCQIPLAARNDGGRWYIFKNQPR